MLWDMMRKTTTPLLSDGMQYPSEYEINRRSIGVRTRRDDFWLPSKKMLWAHKKTDKYKQDAATAARESMKVTLASILRSSELAICGV